MAHEFISWLDRLDPKNKRQQQLVTIGQKEIDRDEANEWLLRVKVDHQRSLAETVVERYRADMDAGDWIPGTQMVVFDGKGTLVNGQHTLAAFARSSLKKLQVIWQINRDPRAYMGFDHNRKRTARDTAKWNGIEKPGEVVAAATALWAYENDRFKDRLYRTYRSASPTDAQVQQTIKMHPGLDQHLWKNPFPGSELAMGGFNAASYILDCLDEKRAGDFYERLSDGVRLPTKNHPVNVLRRYFTSLEARIRAGETMAPIFKSWNAFVRDEEVPGRLLRKDEAFPIPINPQDMEPVNPNPARVIH